MYDHKGRLSPAAANDMFQTASAGARSDLAPLLALSLFVLQQIVQSASYELLLEAQIIARAMSGTLLKMMPFAVAWADRPGPSHQEEDMVQRLAALLRSEAESLARKVVREAKHTSAEGGDAQLPGQGTLADAAVERAGTAAMSCEPARL